MSGSAFRRPRSIRTTAIASFTTPKGASIHLTRVDPGSVDPERNAHGIYFYAEDVEALAAAMGCRAEHKPWGLIEFAISDPDGTLVRVGWPG